MAVAKAWLMLKQPGSRGSRSVKILRSALVSSLMARVWSEGSVGVRVVNEMRRALSSAVCHLDGLWNLPVEVTRMLRRPWVGVEAAIASVEAIELRPRYAMDSKKEDESSEKADPDG